MVNVCPVLLYQMSSTNDREKSGCINKKLLLEIDDPGIKGLNNKEDILWGKY